MVSRKQRKLKWLLSFNWKAVNVTKIPTLIIDQFTFETEKQELRSMSCSLWGFKLHYILYFNRWQNLILIRELSHGVENINEKYCVLFFFIIAKHTSTKRLSLNWFFYRIFVSVWEWREMCLQPNLQSSNYLFSKIQSTVIKSMRQKTLNVISTWAYLSSSVEEL